MLLNRHGMCVSLIWMFVLAIGVLPLLLPGMLHAAWHGGTILFFLKTSSLMIQIRMDESCLVRHLSVFHHHAHNCLLPSARAARAQRRRFLSFIYAFSYTHTIVAYR